FLVRFEHPDDYHRATFKGPWKIYDYYISVGRWTHDFNEEEPLKTILTWVRLPRLPIHFFNEIAVTRIGNCIGKTVMLDLATTEGARARYARVCVEVDISKPLHGKYMIENRTFLVEYESLENICTSCGFYGHKSEECTPALAPASVETPKENPMTTAVEKPADDIVGEWMVVSRRSKGRVQQHTQPVQAKVNTISRFEALASSDGEVDEEILADNIPTSPLSKTDKTDSRVLAAKLAEALRQSTSLHGEDTASGSSKVKELGDRAPLKDVTNGRTGTNGKRNTPVSSKLVGPQPALVDVPIVYDNPTFRGNKAQMDIGRVKKITNRREKSVTRKDRPSTSARPKRKDGKPIRSFISRKGFPTRDNNQEVKTKVGDPPDRS
ncbi:hypothetical protein LINPERHAP2_LOCUS16026, partial [Linum perenne]